MILVMKSSILVEVEKNGGTTTNMNERKSDKASARGNLDGSGDEEEEGGMIFEENPMHKIEEDIGTLPLREWLMEQVPNLDAPHQKSSTWLKSRTTQGREN